MKKVKEREEVELMVLYKCPGCWTLNLVSLDEIKEDTTWLCPHCDLKMKVV